jgi:F1F0 ATPase subunit 2
MLIMEPWPMSVDLFLALITGSILGCAYFGGLWWTVQRMPTTRRPVVLYIFSLALRAALLLLAVYLVLVQMGVVSLIALLCGFVMIRAWLIHRWGNQWETTATVGRPAH